MPKAERRASDFWCTRCKRRLENNGGPSSRKDTVSPKVQARIVSYSHDGCGGAVVAGN